MKTKIEDILIALFLMGLLAIASLSAVGIDLTPPSALYLKR